MNKVLRTQDLYVRATHPASFRCGQWAKVLRVQWAPERHGDNPQPGRAVYAVEFVDGVRGFWAVYDPAAEYEFTGYVTA